MEFYSFKCDKGRIAFTKAKFDVAGMLRRNDVGTPVLRDIGRIFYGLYSARATREQELQQYDEGWSSHSSFQITFKVWGK